MTISSWLFLKTFYQAKKIPSFSHALLKNFKSVQQDGARSQTPRVSMDFYNYSFLGDPYRKRTIGILFSSRSQDVNRNDTHLEGAKFIMHF